MPSLTPSDSDPGLLESIPDASVIDAPVLPVPDTLSDIIARRRKFRQEARADLVVAPPDSQSEINGKVEDPYQSLGPDGFQISITVEMRDKDRLFYSEPFTSRMLNAKRKDQINSTRLSALEFIDSCTRHIKCALLNASLEFLPPGDDLATDINKAHVAQISEPVPTNITALIQESATMPEQPEF